MSQKSTKGLLIFLSIILIGSISYAGVRLWKGKKEARQEKAPISQTQKEPEASEIDTSDWKMYRNEKYKYTLKIPSPLLIEESSSKRSVEFKMISSNRLNFIFSSLDGIDCNNFIKETLLHFNQGKTSYNTLQIEMEKDPNGRIWNIQRTEGVGGKRTTMLTDYNNNCYLFSFSEDYKEIGQKIIKSITFLPDS